ncbi:hypothetical protein [Dyella sp.]|uniref:hypothetical protein n=1 Tax=Dyella sp. TaxID=1869338 RepID=UPI002D77BF05|nr:hypothetical protein [Dyella sp.]HET6431577.1 hypothetical protein [Dyella sp.]
MNEQVLIANWSEQKLSHNYFRLIAEVTVEHEFVRQRGHPSSYAFVSFSAVPADALALQFSVAWPVEFDSEYCLRIQHTIGEAVVDSLVSAGGTRPYRGCSLTLCAFGWDSVGGSEVAVHRATEKAMESLRQRGQWSIVNGRYRSYV